MWRREGTNPTEGMLILFKFGQEEHLPVLHQMSSPQSSRIPADTASVGLADQCNSTSDALKSPYCRMSASEPWWHFEPLPEEVMNMPWAEV